VVPAGRHVNITESCRLSRRGEGSQSEPTTIANERSCLFSMIIKTSGCGAIIMAGFQWGVR